MRIFTYEGPYNDDLLSDIIKTYTNREGVEIKAELEDTKNPTLRKMIVTVDAPKNTSMLDDFVKSNPNSNLGA
jgi:hypothetical protein